MPPDKPLQHGASFVEADSPPRFPLSAELRKAPGPRQRVAREGAEVKSERILRTAEQLFHRQGYERTTLEQIAQALGVTKPFIYYYFRDKQEIFEQLSWKPTVACFSVLDRPEDEALPAHLRVRKGIEDLIRATLTHYPAAFFAYREPQAYREAYQAEVKRLARHFYDKLCALLEQGRAEGHFDFNETKITALAACSLPGFLHSWYQPQGRLDREAVVRELSILAWRVLGLRDAPTPSPRRAPGRRAPITTRGEKT